jgi:hypothetical protein
MKRVYGIVLNDWNLVMDDEDVRICKDGVVTAFKLKSRHFDWRNRGKPRMSIISLIFEPGSMNIIAERYHCHPRSADPVQSILLQCVNSMWENLNECKTNGLLQGVGSKLFEDISRKYITLFTEACLSLHPVESGPHTLTPCFKIYSNCIVPSTPRSPSCFLVLSFSE